ncbi:hypothetical protein OCH239_17370 [Roseivivax halodurans JCM 10272]|uniref:Glycosyltransferase RgtA/B/C/D-like domain-containing protein n=1 Tax=Roseivivax halodurans JCM 10272 TaxID=1449350 RepID=X7EC88_9RHOB|nr:hypothetical protein [Roseivivax halodurans]ETX12738.1 hypothetical protein OCH239_17370 [Roseivivax halodurans JCM 10272]
MGYSDAHRSSIRERSGSLNRTLLLAGLVFALALASRIALIGLPPIYDELYHLLAALSLSEDGTFAILDGEYRRGATLTRLVALSFELSGGPHVAAARFLPSVLPGAALVLLVFFWVRRVAGFPAAAIVAAFMLLWPNGIQVSQYVRFYALQGLAFVFGAICIHDLLERRTSLWWGVTLGVVGLCALLFALHLQTLTIVGCAALGLWIFLAHGLDWLRRFRMVRLTLVAGLALITVCLVSGAFDTLLAQLWKTYNWEPWPAQNDTTFYHRYFRDAYPTFWSLFPIAALIALHARPRVALFCILLFGVSFVALSFGGLKNIRYLYSVMPFFFATWAIALVHLAGPFLRYLSGIARSLFTPFLPDRWSKRISSGLLALAFGFIFATNAAFERSADLILGTETQLLLDKNRWEWTELWPLARPWLEEEAVVISAEEMRTVQWLGDFDFALNRPRFSELIYSYGPETRPFALDFRTGRPLVPLVEDLRPVMACKPRGIVVSNAPMIDSELARELSQMALGLGATVETRSGAGASLLGWRHPVGAALPACPDLPGLASGTGAAARLLSGESQARHVISASALR